MNKYKRIFHHIDFKEAKSKHLEDLAVKKLEEEKNIKKEKQISKITEEKKYSWRETLKEAEWVALDTGGIANKTTQTFGLTDFGMPVMGPDFNQVTANFGGLGGVDVHPSEFAYNGVEGEGDSQVTPPPTYNQLALAGFTKPLPMLRRQGKLKADEINARLDSSQQVAQKANADYYMNARLEADKKYEEELDKWDKEKEAVDEYNRKLDDEYEKEKERVRVYNERIMMAHHRTMAGVRWDSKRKMGIPTNTPHPGSDLDISNKLRAKYWIPGENGGRGVMTITDQEWAELHCQMGGCANEAKRKALEKKIKPDPERPTYKEYPPKPEPPELKPPEPPTPKKDSLLDIILSHVGKSTPPKALLNLLPSKLKEFIISKWDIIAASAKVFDLFLEGKTDLITNEIVGDRYMDQFIKEQKFMDIDFNGTQGTYVPDGIVGTAPLPTYKGGTLTQTANFSFNNNWEEFVENVNKGVYKYEKNYPKQGILQLILNGGYAALSDVIPILDYAVDANIDPLPPVLAQVGGIIASIGIHGSKKDGGGKDIPIKLTYSAKELYKNNGEMFWVLVEKGIIPEEDAAKIIHGADIKS